MRARLEALAAKWEAEDQARVRSGEPNDVARSGVYAACAADLRALLAEPQRVRMEPQPIGAGAMIKGQAPTIWIWWTGGGDGYAISIEHTAPSPAHRPVLVDGIWWWEVSNDPR